MGKMEPQAEIKDSKIERQKVSGLGALFKAEREKRGLSHDKVAQTTRLRQHFIEALENEEWENLPAPVFVKGFIRSYAKALGLDETKVFDLYERSGPVGEAPPKPLVAPKKSKKGGIFLIIFMLVAVAAVIFIWKIYPKWAPISKNIASLSKNQGKSVKKVQPSAIKSQDPKSVKETEVISNNSKPSAEPKKLDKGEELMAEKETEAPIIDEDLSVQSTPESASLTDWHVLKGIVKGRTWIRIYIDDQEPREYIFQPGSRPQWKAREGFDILIGNAAGVDFDYNGEMVGDLGVLGKVVRLRLPEDFEAKIPED